MRRPLAGGEGCWRPTAADCGRGKERAVSLTDGGRVRSDSHRRGSLQGASHSRWLPLHFMKPFFGIENSFGGS
eukprot:3861791-Pleurochrysis_carterae.AAC.1